MPCKMESASLEPRFGNKFVAGGEDLWVHVFDFHTGAEIGKTSSLFFFFWILVKLHTLSCFCCGLFAPCWVLEFGVACYLNL